jgi:hypothetical protein
MSIKRPTGTSIQAFCTIENNTLIVYDFSENEKTAIVEGLHNCDVVVYSPDHNQIATAKFSMVVNDRVVRRDDIDLTDEDYTIVDDIAKAEVDRRLAETKRVEAETARAAAETKRVEAEVTREDTAKKAVDDLVAVKESVENMRDNGDFDGASVEHSWNGTVLTIKSASGTTSVNLVGPQGPMGEGFRISKTFRSVEEMNAGFSTDGVPYYGFVLIDTGNVNDVDNAKLFIKHEHGYTYLTDLSGSQGIQGPMGPQGPKGDNTPVKGIDYFTPADKNEIVSEAVEILAKGNSGVYLGSWHLSEPLKDISMLKDSTKYNFAFSCFINGTKETKRFASIMRYQASAEHSIIMYYYEGGSNAVVYRTKYGEFSANSYQTITIYSEPPEEIKEFLNANGVWLGNTDADIKGFAKRLETLEDKVDDIAYLESTHDTTDRTAEMQSLLNEHKCLQLGAGEFYLAGQLVIGGGEILEGCGAATKIMQTPDSTQTFMIRLQSEGTIRSVCLQGAWTSKADVTTTPTSYRTGIYVPQEIDNAIIDGCFIHGWTSFGILVSDSSAATQAVIISNCDFCWNYTGMQLQKFEDTCVNHCVFRDNNYGVVNNGGNNKFTACGFDSNIVGLYINELNNNGHGTAVGCTFNHNEKAVYIEDNETGFVFSGCQLHYGAIKILATAKGTMFVGCQFGNQVGYYNYTSNPTLFVGCNFSKTPQTESEAYIDNYGGLRFIACFNYQTGESVDNMGLSDSEKWTFTLDDGTIIEKEVLVNA